MCSHKCLHMVSTQKAFALFTIIQRRKTMLGSFKTNHHCRPSPIFMFPLSILSHIPSTLTERQSLFPHTWMHLTSCLINLNKQGQTYQPTHRWSLASWSSSLASRPWDLSMTTHYYYIPGLADYFHPSLLWRKSSFPKSRYWTWSKSATHHTFPPNHMAHVWAGKPHPSHLQPGVRKIHAQTSVLNDYSKCLIFPSFSSLFMEL